MDEILTNYVESKADSLTLSGDEFALRENLRLVEEGCRQLGELKSQNEDALMRRLRLYLVKFSLRSKNIKLCLLLVAKLKLVQLALVLRAILQPTTNESRNQLIALAHVSNYFHMEEEYGWKLNDNNINSIVVDRERNHKSSPSLFDHEQLTDLYIDRGNWQAALELIDDQYRDTFQNGLNKKLLRFRYAQDHELDENFEEAVKNFIQSDTEKQNAPRVLIKQYMNLAYKELRNYCLSSSNVLLRDIWKEYSLMTRHSPTVNEIKIDDPIMMRTAIIRGPLDELESKIFKLLPKVTQDFIYDTKSADKWADKRKLNSLIAVGSGLSSDQKRTLAELATRYEHSYCQSKACDLYLLLNQTETIVRSAHKFMDPISSVQVANQLASTNGLAYNMIDYINCRSSARSKNGHENHYAEKNENSIQFLAYLKLGLVDEAMQVLAIDSLYRHDEQIILKAIENLQTVIKTSSCSGSLEEVDPEIRDSTLISVQESLLNDQTLVTQVITLIILALNIFLLKLHSATISDNNEGFVASDIRHYIPKLEIMFKRLAESYLEVLNFDASDALVKATNGLVEAVKERLDFLSGSDTIRQNFRKLVELTAAKCMIESRYKSAAVLYSQIEDNVSAVKSLMRMGDVDIVLNYSLLVRDITVNRLTINYLKHLNVEQEVIEDFISKSNMRPSS